MLLNIINLSLHEPKGGRITTAFVFDISKCLPGARLSIRRGQTVLYKIGVLDVTVVLNIIYFWWTVLFSDSNQQRLIEAMEPPPQSSCGGKQQTRLDRRLAKSCQNRSIDALPSPIPTTLLLQQQQPQQSSHAEIAMFNPNSLSPALRALILLYSLYIVILIHPFFLFSSICLPSYFFSYLPPLLTDDYDFRLIHNQIGTATKWVGYPLVSKKTDRIKIYAQRLPLKTERGL